MTPPINSEEDGGSTFFANLRRLCRCVEVGVNNLHTKFDVHGRLVMENSHTAFDIVREHERNLHSLKVSFTVSVFGNKHHPMSLYHGSQQNRHVLSRQGTNEV